MSAHTLAVAVVGPQEADGTLPVRWRLNPGQSHHGGLVKVRGLEGESDPSVAAELAVAEHLLVTQEVAGPNRTGKGLTLEMTRGAIRKLAHGKSSKTDLAPRARFLWTRFVEATIHVRKNMDWLAESPESVAELDLTEAQTSTGDRMAPAGIGPIRVTRHALDRYQERAALADYDRAWRRLHKRLESDLKEVQLPQSERTRKRLKHKGEQERILRDKGGWHFVLVPSNDGPSSEQTLVTVFHRDR